MMEKAAAENGTAAQVEAPSSGRLLLGMGIALRLLTFAFLKPENVDGHSFVVSFIVQHGRLPHSGELGQAYHPPLYYWLAAPIYRLSGSFKAVQVFSLLLSILTLLVFYRLIYRPGLISGHTARLYSFAFVCFLPQFVLYGLFVSNDTLSVFLGCAAVWCIAQFVSSPNAGKLAILALVGILGLLTKATFMAYLPVLCFLVLFVSMKAGRSVTRSLAVALGFALVVAAAASYKEIDNYRQYGHAFISNIDFHPDWAIRQQGTYQGTLSYINADFRRLISSPSLSSSTESAYPLMLYATFWYQHIPECSFFGSSHRPFTFLAVAIYILALVPTATFLVGIRTLGNRLPCLLRRFRSDNQQDCHALTRYAATGLLIANLGIMIAALVKYHVCSIMQGRLLFPSFFGILAVFAVGTEQMGRNQWGSRLLKFSVAALCVLFVTYLLGEIAVTVVQRFMPGVKEYLKAIAA